jgi:hypothetical protein
MMRMISHHPSKVFGCLSKRSPPRNLRILKSPKITLTTRPDAMSQVTMRQDIMRPATRRQATMRPATMKPILKRTKLTKKGHVISRGLNKSTLLSTLETALQTKLTLKETIPMTLTLTPPTEPRMRPTKTTLRKRKKVLMARGI